MTVGPKDLSDVSYSGVVLNFGHDPIQGAYLKAITTFFKTVLKKHKALVLPDDSHPLQLPWFHRKAHAPCLWLGPHRHLLLQ